MEPRRKSARAATPGGVTLRSTGAMSAAQSTPTPTLNEPALAHIEAVLNAGGQVLFGTIAPVPGAAVAHDGKNTLAMLQRRPNESVAALLIRLDAAIATAWTTGSRVDEINSDARNENYKIANPSLRPAVNTARR